jgi:hypothetical protein
MILTCVLFSFGYSYNYDMYNFACILIFVVFQKECGKFEAHVVRLETQEENKFLKSFMANYFKGDKGEIKIKVFLLTVKYY